MVVSVYAQNGVALVTIDNPPVNAASAAVREGLARALARTEADRGVSAVILHCAGMTFVAGADISEFGGTPLKPHLPDVIDDIERASKPWVAALHGTVLGGGLELAMGCHARIADRNTKLGLPEVTLGLIPGAGGTVRLPRLVTADLALTMVAGGKPITAPDAQTAGLIDEIADDDLLERATGFARELRHVLPTRERPLRKALDTDSFQALSRELRAKARGQMSPVAAVEAIERALALPFDEALTAERETFLKLKSSPQSASLRRLFFAERGALKRDPRARAASRPLAGVGIVGGGTMGTGIAAACLMRGLPVILAEQTDKAAQAARTRVTDTLTASAKRGLVPDLDLTLSRFQTGVELDDLTDADLVIEAVFEDMHVKKSLFAELDRVTKPEAVLATNTSYLDVNEIASVLKDPSRAIGLHFFSPAHIMKLLEIVLPDRVADDVVATGAALSKRLGKIGVFSGVCEGFIGNRIMSAYRQEADFLIEEGASPQEVDAAMRAFGFAMGVFEMQDLAGLDIAWAMRKRRAASPTPSERYVR
ncbi:MAG: 3-hydroxyacyl-CoA dehydrogenase NAD-binding domain-containing protein, partial [Rhodobacter sp.]|nr:3-hydroxyacyl-CoA dehydrogenase NAD-binding domain-containing protein [Rhodobacter sp.]